jgi:glycosyltransferase involved in cell wall biosynthesis
MKISATIITFNEANNIAAACESVAWADELIVVDSESTDNTREIAERCGAKVVVRRWPGFAVQKQYAAELATYDWILSLDADERVSEELKRSILRLREEDKSKLAHGYRIPRRSFYMDRWIRGGGWYPDYQLRLYNRTHGRWEGAYIHESVKMRSDARIGKLSGDILHYSMISGLHHHQMLGERYAPLAAEQMFEAGRRTSPLQIALAGPSTFLRSYILKGGFRDGLAGFCIARFAAHNAFLKHLLLWEKQKKN